MTASEIPCLETLPQLQPQSKEEIKRAAGISIGKRLVTGRAKDTRLNLGPERDVVSCLYETELGSHKPG